VISSAAEVDGNRRRHVQDSREVGISVVDRFPGIDQRPWLRQILAAQVNVPTKMTDRLGRAIWALGVGDWSSLNDLRNAEGGFDDRIVKRRERWRKIMATSLSR